MAHKITTKCIECGICLAVCPEDAIKDDINRNLFLIIPEKCTDCGKCVEACPADAIIYKWK